MSSKQSNMQAEKVKPWRGWRAILHLYEPAGQVADFARLDGYTVNRLEESGV